MESGDTKRAEDFVKLDAGSEWAAYVTPSLLLREGKIDQAREAVTKMPTAPRYHRDLLEACLRFRPYSDAQEMAHVAETTTPAAPDAAQDPAERGFREGIVVGERVPETSYWCFENGIHVERRPPGHPHLRTGQSRVHKDTVGANWSPQSPIF